MEQKRRIQEVEGQRGLRTLSRLLEMDQIYERIAKKLAKLIWSTH